MKRFLVAQKLLLFNSRNQVLVLRSSANELNPKECWGKWDFPGGTLEWSEGLEAGLRREVKEEAGQIKYKLGKPILTWDWVFEDRPEERKVCILYTADFLGGKIKISPEHDRYQWLEIQVLIKKPGLWPKINQQVIKRLAEIYRT